MDSEVKDAWDIILAHPSVHQDAQVVCKALLLCKSGLGLLAAQLPIHLTSSSLQHLLQFIPWLLRNCRLLKALAVELRDPSGPANALACTTLSVAVEQAVPLVSLKAGPISTTDESSVVSALSGSHLTHLELNFYGDLLTDDHQHHPTPGPPSSSAITNLASMTNLRALALSQPTLSLPRSAVHPSNTASWSWYCCLSSVVPSLSQLTRLDLPVGGGEFNPNHMQHLPKQLLELTLGMDVVDGEDGYPVQYGGAKQIQRERQQRPFDMAHLTALTKLSLSMMVPIVAGDVLPPHLQQLAIKQCFSVDALRRLTGLQQLAMFPSTVPGTQLAQLTSLAHLQSVKLWYEGGYRTDGVYEGWPAERIDSYAAAWVKLPVQSLSLSFGPGPNGGVFYGLSAATFDAIAQLSGLTSLNLDWGTDVLLLRTALPQLMQLQELRIDWRWFEDARGYQGDAAGSKQLGVALNELIAAITDMRLKKLQWYSTADGEWLDLEGLTRGFERYWIYRMRETGNLDPARVFVEELVYELRRFLKS